MQISARLQKVASFVTEGNRIADVGTDHGYVPIYLIKRGKIPAAIAMDIKKGPLARAREHIETEGLSGQIVTRLSDGLSKYQKGEADTIVIAGLGGELMIKILQEGKGVLDGIKEMVLSPHSEIYKVRRYLKDAGFCIVKETMVHEDGKYYTVMKVIPGTMQYETEAEIWYGKLLLQERHPVLFEYLNQEQKICDKILEELTYAGDETKARRQAEIIEKKQRIWEAIRYYEGMGD